MQPNLTIKDAAMGSYLTSSYISWTLLNACVIEQLINVRVSRWLAIVVTSSMA
jgi:hypothetical protein